MSSTASRWVGYCSSYSDSVNRDLKLHACSMRQFFYLTSISNCARLLLKIEAHEIRAALTAFSFLFTLMLAYYTLRPVRDAMASDWSDAELSWLWTSTFVISLVVVSVYSGVISRISFKRIVPGVYGFFSLSFLAFYLGARTMDNPVYADKAFYVWLSVFSLFHVSVFWSFMTDMFSKEQGKRLFGFIASGASIGAVAGPAVPVFFSAYLGVYNLILLAAALLALMIPLSARLEKLKRMDLQDDQAGADESSWVATGGNPLAGFADFFSNRHLLGIGLFILLYTVISAFVYFELKNMLADFDRATRSQYWGLMDLIVNSLAVITAMFATNRLAVRFGLRVTLSIIPFAIVAGWLIVAIAPLLSVLMGLQIARRAGNYAITRPGREMLFTEVSRETRFRTKPVIDIVVYRGGDMLSGWVYTGLAAGFGLGLTGMGLIGASIALLWAIVAIFIGNAYDRDRIATGEPE